MTSTQMHGEMSKRYRTRMTELTQTARTVLHTSLVSNQDPKVRSSLPSFLLTNTNLIQYAGVSLPTAESALGEVDASLIQDQSPKVRPSPRLLPHLKLLIFIINAANSTPAPLSARQPSERSSRRTTTRTLRPRLAAHSMHPRTRILGAHRGIAGLRLIGRVVILASDVEQLAEAVIEGGLGKCAAAPTSMSSPIHGSTPSPTQHEVLQNFLKSLLNRKDRAASPWTAESPGAVGTIAAESVGVGASGKMPVTGPWTSSGSVGGEASRNEGS